MSSKFSQVRNRRSKPPHCKPGLIYPPPYLPYKPEHLYCRILHEFHTPDNKWNYEFHLFEYTPYTPPEFSWARNIWNNSHEKLYYIAYINSGDNFKTFDLVVSFAGSFGGTYFTKPWDNQVPIRQFPLKTKLLHGHSLQASTENFVTVQIIDTGKDYPPPEPGNYGPY